MMPLLVIFLTFVGMTVLGKLLGKSLLKSLAIASWFAFFVATTFMVINGLGEPMRVTAIEDKPIDEGWYPFFAAIALLVAGVVFSALTFLFAVASGSKKAAQTLVDSFNQRSQRAKIQIIQPGEDWRRNQHSDPYKDARRARIKERVISGTIVALIVTFIYWAFGFFSQKCRNEWEKRIGKKEGR